MDSLNNLPFNVIDIGVLLILLVSAVLAYARGFVHEVLAVGGWIGAIFATFYGVSHAKVFVREFTSSDMIAAMAAGVIIFITTLVFLSLLTRAISKHVKASALNALDRSLGFLFGLLRGAVLICVAYIGLELMVPKDEQPTVIRDARTMQLIEPGAALLKSLVPDHISGKSTGASSTSQGLNLDKLVAPTPKQSDTPAREGYDAEQRKSLERLLDGTGSNN